MSRNKGERELSLSLYSYNLEAKPPLIQSTDSLEQRPNYIIKRLTMQLLKNIHHRNGCPQSTFLDPVVEVPSDKCVING
jgi:hypothetical protein